MVPRGYARTGTTPDGKEGLKWKAKYASVGANGVGLPVLFDGVNEKGLAAGTFYFPTSAGYMPYYRGRCGQDDCAMGSGFVDPGELCHRRGGESEHRQHRRARGRVRGWGFAPEAHYIVHDASGKSIVIEYVGGKLNVYDNPLGVITNSPTFDWHMTNLRNYVNFSMTNVPPVQLGSITLQPLGQGSGMLGMPGDFTPPSRFVRAVAFSQSVSSVEDRGRRGSRGVSHPEPIRHPQRRGPRTREGRARQYPGRLYALDRCQRSQGKAVLLPHLRE